MKNARGKQQRGGNGRVIPKYVDERNTPFKTKERKDLDTQRYKENPNPAGRPKNEQPMIEFKVNGGLLGQQQKVPSYNQIYPSPYVPIQNPLPPEYPYVTGSNPHAYNAGGSQHMYPWIFTPNNVPVIKNYNISLSNPSGDHVQISDLYEDMLPKSKFKNTSITLGERNMIYDYVRATLVSVSDGEDIDITGKIKSGTGANKKNLLSYLKLLELNPYHNNSLTPNPYVSLPDRMILYRSCYPIRFNANSNKITCSRTSIGLNLRIYDVSIAELNASRIYNILNPSKFDLWREISFYETIREEILKKKQCPNFAMLYAYFISSQSGINFNKIRQVKREKGVPLGDLERKQQEELRNLVSEAEREMMADGSNVTLPELNTKKNQLMTELNNIIGQARTNQTDARKREIMRELKEINRKIGLMGMRNNNMGLQAARAIRGVAAVPIVTVNAKNMTNGPIDLAVPLILLNNGQTVDYSVAKKVGKQVYKNLDINLSTGQTLLALTEAPHYNILQWAKKTYLAQHLGPIKRAISTGYRNEKVWLSVIFQIMAGLHAMYKNDIAIKDIAIGDNIFIKDLMTSNDQNAGYWKYIINGYEYFVPNYGYLVMIDTNYKNIAKDNRTIKDIHKVNDEFKISDMEYKIYGSIDPDYNNKDAAGNLTPEAQDMHDKVKKYQYEGASRILDRNNFGLKFKNDGGVPPPGDIMNILGNINTDIIHKNDKDGNLSNIIQKHMDMFLNNRIGTLLTNDEVKEGVSDTQPVNWKTGKLYVHKLDANKYVFVIYVGPGPDVNQVLIKTRKGYTVDDTVENKNIAKDEIFEYISLNAIKQKYKAGEKMGEEHLLETYNM